MCIKKCARHSPMCFMIIEAHATHHDSMLKENFNKASSKLQRGVITSVYDRGINIYSGKSGTIFLPTQGRNASSVKNS